MINLIVFVIENQLHAVEVAAIKAVVPFCHLIGENASGGYVLGYSHSNGFEVPVLNMRKMLHLPEKQYSRKDQLIVCGSGGKGAAIWADSVNGVARFKVRELIPAREGFSEIPSLEYVIYNQSVVIFVHNIDALIHLTECSTQFEGAEALS